MQDEFDTCYVKIIILQVSSNENIKELHIYKKKDICNVYK